MSKTTLESRRDRRAEERTSGARRRAREAAAARQRRTRMLMYLTGVLVIVIVAGAVLISQLNKASTTGITDAASLNPAGQMLPLNSTAPNFTLSTVDGKSYSLSHYRGKAVLLEFFAVWCPHCQAMAPVLNQLDTAYGKKGAQTLAVLANPYGKNYDLSGGTDLRLADKSDVTWFESTYAVKHPSLIDPKFATVNKYGANSYPTIYIIDRKGKIVYHSQGETPYKTLSTAMDKALKS